MPTKKRRLNISLPDRLSVFLKQIALRDDVPEATKARDLIERALELEEDAYFSTLADQMDARTKKWISHEAFWSKLL